jgi:heme oxygenase
MLESMSSKSASPLERIRMATRAAHARLHANPYAIALSNGTLPIACYASFLRALYVLHSGLLQLVGDSASAPLRAAFGHGGERCDRLTRDLAALKLDPSGVDAAFRHALALMRQLRTDADSSTETLFGHVYVLEGSQLGGLAQKAALSKRSELQYGGLAYLSGAGSETLAQFRAFCAELEVALRDERAVTAAVSGAEHAFAGVEAIMSAVILERA